MPTFNAPYTASGDSTPMVKSDAAIPSGGGGVTLGFVAESLGLGHKPRFEAAFGGWTGSSTETDGEGFRSTTLVPSIDGTASGSCGGCDGTTTVKFDHHELGGVFRLKSDFALGSRWTVTPAIGFVGSLSRTRYRSDTPFFYGNPNLLPPAYVEERLDTVRLGGEVGFDVGFQLTQKLSLAANSGVQLLAMDTDFDGHDCFSNNQSNTLPCSGSGFATSVRSDDDHFGVRVPVSATVSYDFGWIQLAVRGFGLWDDSMPGVDNPTTRSVARPASLRASATRTAGATAARSSRRCRSRSADAPRAPRFVASRTGYRGGWYRSEPKEAPMTPTPRWLVLAAPAIAGALLLATIDRPAEAMKIHPLHDHVLVRVADTDDPEGMGRIQVVFPALPEPSQSPMRFRTEWARLLVPLAGADRGSLSLPEVGDEVLVGFVGGDVSRPVIVGRLWNGDDPPPESR